MQESSLITRNVFVDGRRTSIRLEMEMWGALLDIAARERRNVHEICSLVNRAGRRPESSLTAAIRVFIMAYFRAAATEDGHATAQHGKGFVNMPLLPVRTAARRVA